MQRLVFQTFLSATFRPGVKISATPRLHFHIMKNALLSKSPSSTTVVEKRTDFSDLSSEKFGTLRPQKSVKEKVEVLPEEEDERDEFDFTNAEGRKTRRPVEFYENLILNFLNENKLVEALDVLETRMLKKDKVNPRYRVYNLLINGCARLGYCEKAFELYQKMKERQVKRTKPTYTGLFNACANSPFPEDAAKKLTTLRKSLAENGIELTIINYHAMIKAYARLKDTHSAFLVVDEMLCKGHAMNSETCAFLLQACISDSEAGLRHALLLWHKMRSKKITPSLYVYNLLIRCIRDCGLGTEEDLKDVLREIIDMKRQENHRIVSGQTPCWPVAIDWKKKKVKNDESVLPETSQEAISDTDSEIKENRPNLLAENPHLGTIVSVKNVVTPSDRLLLLGGFKTLLEQMKNDGVQPDVKSLTQLLDIMPSTDVAEKHLLDEFKNYDVHIDIDFCNMLIKKRAMRGDYEKAREVLDLIQSNYLNPDIVTFGVLAVSCKNEHEAEQLISEMRAFDFRLNMPILGAMLEQAVRHFDFYYAIYIMKMTQKIKIPVSLEYMDKLKKLETKMNSMIRRMKRKDQTVPAFLNKPSYLEAYRMWKDYYYRFKDEVQISIPPHPYKQFKKDNYDLESAKNAEEKPKFTRRKYTTDGRSDSKGIRLKPKFSSLIDQDRNGDTKIDPTDGRIDSKVMRLKHKFTSLIDQERNTDTEIDAADGRSDSREIGWKPKFNSLLDQDRNSDLEVDEVISQPNEYGNGPDSTEKQLNKYRRERKQNRKVEVKT